MVEKVFEEQRFTTVDLGDIGEVRKLLGPTLASKSDDEIMHIRDLIVGFADDAFDWWLHKSNEEESRM